MTGWLLCDYGEVLCEAQPPGEVDALASAAGVDRESWDAAYWRHRADYDRGALDAGGYWSATVARTLTDEEVAGLVDLDVRSWLHPAASAVAATRATGRRLAILSNAPHEVADAIDRQPWLADFRPRLFSARLGLTKPDPAIYHRALTELGADPDDVCFVDDRAANVAAASAVGMRTVHYTGDPSVFTAGALHT